MRIVVVAIVLLLSLVPLASAQDTPAQEVDYLACDYSGLRWDTSSTRIEVTIFHGEKKSTLHFASLYGMMMYIFEAEMEDEDIGNLGEFKMLDYDSYGKDKPVWIISGGDGPPEMFVVHTENPIPGSQPPFMAAFVSEESAKTWAGRWKGEVYDAEGAMDVLMEIVMPEMEEQMPHDDDGVDAPPPGDEK